MAVRTYARWVLLHGGSKAMMWNARRKGDPTARIMLERRLRQDPYPLYEEIRAQGRLVQGSFVWVTVDHELAQSVLRDPRFGIADPASLDLPRPVEWLFRITDPHVVSPVEPPSMLAVDPPQHTRYRKLVSKAFTVRAIEALRSRVEEIADELLDRLAGRPTADLATQYADQLPVTVIAEILGVPADMRAQFLTWGNAVAPILDMGLPYRTYREAMGGMRALNDWFAGHFARLRSDPGEDILSRLVNLDDDGDRLSHEELMATALLLLGAGFETTVNLIGNGAVLLLEQPDQLARLREDPALWPNAVEEVLRYDSPVQATARLALEDVVLGDVVVPKGRLVATLLGGANRDPAAFAEPGRFDVGRANAREHLSFSSGVHFCLGASLARMEGEIALRALFERFPDVAFAGTPRRRDMMTLHGFEALPVAVNGDRARRTAAVG